MEAKPWALSSQREPEHRVQFALSCFCPLGPVGCSGLGPSLGASGSDPDLNLREESGDITAADLCF